MKNARLILVEDDPFTRATLGDALTLHGFDIRARVGTAFDAIDAQRKHDPQVALLDLDLGIGASGIDVAIALRKNNSKIGIVFLTTYKDPRLINSGFKPIIWVKWASFKSSNDSTGHAEMAPSELISTA